MAKISVVINTLNESATLPRAIKSASFADEVLVCDMHSEDNSSLIAQKLGARVVFHKRLNFVEPARNYAISQAKYDWILILDPDEEIPPTLASRLRQIASENKYSYTEIPRKNIIFGRWMKASMWWPDLNIRFFKKGSVEWGDKIHQRPKTKGEGLFLDPAEENALIHHHYTSISQFLQRLDRYTSIQATEINDEGYKFHWKSLFQKPLSEFLGRFFTNKGYEDGVFGLSLSLLQAFSFLIVYLKIWEIQRYPQQQITINDLKLEADSAGKEISYWIQYSKNSRQPLRLFIKKIKSRILNG